MDQTKLANDNIFNEQRMMFKFLKKHPKKFALAGCLTLYGFKENKLMELYCNKSAMYGDVSLASPYHQLSQLYVAMDCSNDKLLDSTVSYFKTYITPVINLCGISLDSLKLFNLDPQLLFDNEHIKSLSQNIVRHNNQSAKLMMMVLGTNDTRQILLNLIKQNTNQTNYLSNHIVLSYYPFNVPIYKLIKTRYSSFVPLVSPKSNNIDEISNSKFDNVFFKVFPYDFHRLKNLSYILKSMISLIQLDNDDKKDDLDNKFPVMDAFDINGFVKSASNTFSAEYISFDNLHIGDRDNIKTMSQLINSCVADDNKCPLSRNKNSHQLTSNKQKSFDVTLNVKYFVEETDAKLSGWVDLGMKHIGDILIRRLIRPKKLKSIQLKIQSCSHFTILNESNNLRQLGYIQRDNQLIPQNSSYIRFLAVPNLQNATNFSDTLNYNDQILNSYENREIVTWNDTNNVSQEKEGNIQDMSCANAYNLLDLNHILEIPMCNVDSIDLNISTCESNNTYDIANPNYLTHISLLTENEIFELTKNKEVEIESQKITETSDSKNNDAFDHISPYLSIKILPNFCRIQKLEYE